MVKLLNQIILFFVLMLRSWQLTRLQITIFNVFFIYCKFHIVRSESSEQQIYPIFLEWCISFSFAYLR